ncbi:hypothetical protein OESDEN_14967 [Oesophagostomum dentatum]|uniref:Choline/carnitine acyltransferase domain-containing protein n=1 Tax=Oesophagostomum dentatum TaxID=61180 RepID=A0A0B1SQ33_OESDE|nr:hypothetical protein OESDEN_14967 [Oesophagostomum dentatum]
MKISFQTDCMNGSGMDRHLLAWNLLAAENNLSKPSILQTPAYEQMTHYQVSTSQVPTRHKIQLFFGPSAPDCYGVCYNPQETEMHFAITTFNSYASTSSKRRNRPILGGVGHVVEIDETFVTRRRYNRGRWIRRHKRLFGGYERGSDESFQVLVRKRDAATLLKLIVRYIRPGTAIVSDCW